MSSWTGDYIVVADGWETAALVFEKAAACANKRLASGSRDVYIKSRWTGNDIGDHCWQAPAMVILAMARELGSGA